MIRVGILFLLLNIFIFSTIDGMSQSLQNRIEQAMNQFESEAQFNHAISSLTVLDGQTGEVVYSHNSSIGLAPASNLKVLTASSAFFLLGKDYRYKTELYYSGEIKEGVLLGNIIIKGGGDPTLGSWRYDDTKMEQILKGWVQAIQNAGIREIKGAVIGDASIFDSQTTPDGWPWEDMGNYYGAGVSGLTWHENQYDLHLKPSQTLGGPVRVEEVVPGIVQLNFANELKTGKAGTGDQVYIYTAPYGNLAYLRGTAPIDRPVLKPSGSIPDPALSAATSLHEALLEQNISAFEPPTSDRILLMQGMRMPETFNLLNTHFSPPLPEMAHWFLQKSINLYGEHLVKTIALEGGKQVNTRNGVTLEKQFWANRGLDSNALHVDDGSGLSPQNRITTGTLAQILYQVQKEEWFPDFKEGLPIIHNIRMKSGHVKRVAAYSGYLTSREGTPLVFSFIVNNFNGYSSTTNRKMFRLLDKIKR